MKELSLYIHIPFCKSKCHYCDFLSFSNTDEKIAAYIKALLKELDFLHQIKDKYFVKTIFIGGGTPTYIHVDHILRVMEKITDIMILDEAVEITIEGNPGTFNKKTLLLLKNMGINRLSIGLQCWQNSLLNSIGRIHTQKDFLYSFESAREAEFNNINIDLIFGLPSQNLLHWEETLQKVINLDPDHLSCYSLKIEEGTVFDKKLRSNEIEVSDTLDRKMYDFAKRFLQNKGYKHYEISNFSKPDFQCKHNLVYWELKSYLGFGLGAHSFFDEFRYNNEKNLNKYIDSQFAGDTIVKEKKFVDAKSFKEEYIFLGLRKIQGINKEQYEKLFSRSIEVEFADTINHLIDLDLIEESESVIKLTKKGLDFANQVFIAFID